MVDRDENQDLQGDKHEAVELSEKLKEKGRLLATLDTFPRSKCFCIPLNLLSVRSLAAAIMVTFAVQLGLALATLFLTTKVNMTKQVTTALQCAILLHAITSGIVMVLSAILCFKDRSTLTMKIWLFVTAFAGYIQALSTAAIIGSIWAEFERNRQLKQTETFKELSGIHFALLLMFASFYPLVWILTTYAWRAVFFFLSFETEFVFNQMKKLTESSLKWQESCTKVTAEPRTHISKSKSREMPLAQESEVMLPAPETGKELLPAPESGEKLPSAPETGEELPPAPESGKELPSAPETGEELPPAAVTGEELPSVPETDEELPQAPETGELPSAPETVEELPQAPDTGEELPLAPKTGEEMPPATEADDELLPLAAEPSKETNNEQNASKEIVKENEEDSSIVRNEMVEKERIAELVDHYFAQQGAKKKIPVNPTSPKAVPVKPSKPQKREMPNEDAIEELVNNWFANNRQTPDKGQQDAKKIYRDEIKKT